ncbi:MAG: serine hydrolase domain-containing protein [Hyphomonadaceae bacterium]
MHAGGLIGVVLALAIAFSNVAVAEAAAEVAASGSPPAYAVELDRRARERFGADAPGCIVEVIRDGREEFVGAYGLADIETRTPLQPSSRMAIASVSKQFTAFAILLLHHDGQLDLDAPIASYLDRLPEWGRQVTVADLLHHASGVRDYIQLQELRGLRYEDYYSADDLFDLIGRTTLEFEPGARTSYSNSGYFLLGQIVERVSGMSLRSFMARRIFGPLGMTDTFLQDDMDERFDRQAFGYTLDENGAIERDGSTLEIVGDGGLVTTAHDLALWDANFYDNRLGGGAALIERMLRGYTLRNGEPTPHAAGLFVRNHRGQIRIGHTGNYGGFKALVQRYPELATTIVLLCNSDAISPIAEERWITDLVMGDLLEPRGPSRAPQAQDLDRSHQALRRPLRTGRYYSEELDVEWRLHRAGVGYEAQLPSGVTFSLDAAGPERLVMREGWFEVIPVRGGFELRYDDMTPIVFRRTGR